MDWMNEFWVMYQGPGMTEPAVVGRKIYRAEAQDLIMSRIKASEKMFPGLRTVKQRRALYTIREVLPL